MVWKEVVKRGWSLVGELGGVGAVFLGAIGGDRSTRKRWSSWRPAGFLGAFFFLKRGALENTLV